MERHPDVKLTLNAMLLARDATVEQVAEALKFRVSPVDAYAALFFDVLDRKDDPAYLLMAAKGCGIRHSVDALSLRVDQASEKFSQKAKSANLGKDHYLAMAREAEAMKIRLERLKAGLISLADEVNLTKKQLADLREMFLDKLDTSGEMEAQAALEKAVAEAVKPPAAPKKGGRR